MKHKALFISQKYMFTEYDYFLDEPALLNYVFRNAIMVMSSN